MDATGIFLRLFEKTYFQTFKGAFDPGFCTVRRGTLFVGERCALQALGPPTCRINQMQDAGRKMQDESCVFVPALPGVTFRSLFNHVKLRVTQAPDRLYIYKSSSTFTAETLRRPSSQQTSQPQPAHEANESRTWFLTAKSESELCKQLAALQLCYPYTLYLSLYVKKSHVLLFACALLAMSILDLDWTRRSSRICYASIVIVTSPTSRAVQENGYFICCSTSMINRLVETGVPD